MQFLIYMFINYITLASTFYLVNNNNFNKNLIMQVNTQLLLMLGRWLVPRWPVTDFIYWLTGFCTFWAHKVLFWLSPVTSRQQTGSGLAELPRCHKICYGSVKLVKNGVHLRSKCYWMKNSYGTRPDPINTYLLKYRFCACTHGHRLMYFSHRFHYLLLTAWWCMKHRGACALSLALCVFSTEPPRGHIVDKIFRWIKWWKKN